MAGDNQKSRIADVTPQTMDLYDDFVPGIDAGSYRFVVQQTIRYDKPQAGTHVYYRDQRFVVKGPRYSIPPGDVQAVFPPNGGTGNYRHILPHVVLRKRALPWERLLWRVEEDQEPAPWLALLVLSQEEMDQARRAFDQKDSPKSPTTLLNSVTPSGFFSATPGVGPGLNDKDSLLPAIDPKVDGEGDEADQTSKVNVIDLPLETFRAVCPRQADLGYLAHVRCVDTSNKAPLQMHADGDFAVMVANRFPQPGANIVHLVSLEGWASVIENLDNAGWQPPADRVRLVSLASWTFVDDEAGIHTFGQLMENLGNGLLQAASHDAGSGDGLVDAYLAHGYVPVEYQPLDSSPTFAWYRGPLSPAQVENLSAGEPYARADEALVLDAKTGLMDLSYAAAWQVGRLLALSSPSFADDLRTFLNKYHDQNDAFAAVKDLEEFLVQSQAAVGDAWKQELQQLARRLRDGEADDEQVMELIDGLMGAGLSAEQAEALLQAFEVVGSDQTHLGEVLAEVGLTQAQIDELLAFLAATPGKEVVMPEVQAADEMLHWIGRLALLYSVPYNYLVPHEKLLPAETIRFFYVDNNWLETLVDGALSIAVDCARDHQALGTKRTDLRRSISQLVYQYRHHLRGLLDRWEPAAEAPDTYLDEIKTGFLLRSAAVSGWPGLEIECHSVPAPGDEPEAQPGRKLTLLRLDHLAPDLVLCLAEGKIDQVVIKEPSEGIRFGVDSDGQVMGRHWIGDGPGEPLTGVKLQVLDVQAQPGAERPGLKAEYHRTGTARGVLAVASLAQALDQRIAEVSVVSDADRKRFRSAAFALQMLRSPQSQRILWH